MKTIHCILRIDKQHERVSEHHMLLVLPRIGEHVVMGEERERYVVEDVEHLIDPEANPFGYPAIVLSRAAPR